MTNITQTMFNAPLGIIALPPTNYSFHRKKKKICVCVVYLIFRSNKLFKYLLKHMELWNMCMKGCHLEMRPHYAIIMIVTRNN